MPPFFSRRHIAAACAALCAAASAQTSNPPQEPTLTPIIVTANPLGANDVVAPAQALSGSGLLLRQ
ncbi:MAG: hypothetical protein ACKO1L_11925 [Brachymonas sp.]